MSSSTSELIFNNTVVRAGAGAGKTTRLVEEVIAVARKFFLQNQKFPTMILTTFTRKATQELKERLTLRACELEDQELIDYLSSNSFLQISTIHGVMSLFLRRYGHLAGFDNGFQLMSDEEASRLAKTLLKNMVFEDEINQSVISQFGILKTSRLLRRYSQLKLEFPKLRSIQMTDLEQAWHLFWLDKANEFNGRLLELKNSTQDSKYIDYIETILQAVQDAASSTEGHSNSLELIASRIPTKPRLNKKNPQLSENMEEDLKNIVKEFKAQLKKPEMAINNWSQITLGLNKLQKMGDSFSSRFLKLKLEAGSLEISDLENMSLKVLRDFPELGKAFASDFDYWLIDEYQDTSPIQVQLLNHLIGNKKSFTVGDPQQSIYLFRGARSEVFQNRQEMAISKNENFEEKKQNWRSRPELLCFFNDLFQGVDKEQFAPMTPRSKDHNPLQVVARFHQTSLIDKEADQEAHLHAIGHQISLLLKRGVPPEEICILARTNSLLLEVAHYLSFHGFPTHLHASGGFYRRREIKDALALLKFLVNPFDNKNLIALLRSPWCRVADTTLSEVLFKQKGSYWSILESSPVLENHSVIRVLKELRGQREEIGITMTFQTALVELGFIDFSHHHDITGRRESNIWKLVSLLKEEEKKPGFSFLQFIGRNRSSIDLENLDQDSDAVAALEPNHIQLMTIHSSKGLQFEHVIVPNIGASPAPSRYPLVTVDEDQEIWSVPLPLGENLELQGSVFDLLHKTRRKKMEDQESLRVFYVAATRAKESLFLGWNEGAHASSWVQQLPFQLTPGVHQRKEYSYEFSKEFYRAQTHSEIGSGHLKIRPAYRALTSKLVEKQAVTALVQDDVKSSAQNVSAHRIPKRIQKAVEGVWMHEAMEQLQGNWNLDLENLEILKWIQHPSQLIEGILWLKELEEPPMRDIISNGFVEWGYQYLKNDQIIEGQVDLWGVVGDTTWILDYKTGSQEYAESAFTQLRFYAEAIQKLHPWSNIKLAVLYPLDQVVKVQNY